MDFLFAFKSMSSQCFGLIFGDSHDILYLYSDWTVRKLFITSSILKEFLCDEAHIPCLCNQEMNIEVFCVYVL